MAQGGRCPTFRRLDNRRRPQPGKSSRRHHHYVNCGYHPCVKTARALIGPWAFLFGLLAAAVCCAILSGGALAQQRSSSRWITAWATSQQALGAATVSGATVRMIARVTASGDSIRIRIDNTFGTTPLRIGDAYVGLRVQGPALAAGSNRHVDFNGQGSVLVPPGGSVTSDPVMLHVVAWQDVAVSLFVPDMNVHPSEHTGAVVTSYLTANGAGDVASAEGRMPFTLTTTSTYWLKGIDVLSGGNGSTVVAFGDSITDGTCSTLDAHDRWEDWLSVRLRLQAADDDHPFAVINEGIGGNTASREHLEPPPDSPTAVERLDRDVLSHTGVSHVVVFVGTNDIRRGASAAQVIEALDQIARRLKARGLPVYASTIIPRHNAAPSGSNTGWDASKTAIRKQVNEWIRGKAPFDSVIDFDSVVRDSSNTDLIAPPFNCGDGIHPSPFGYLAMGNAVPLDLFKRR